MLKIMIGLFLVFALAFGMGSTGPVALPPPLFEGVVKAVRRAGSGLSKARLGLPRIQWRIRSPNVWSPGYIRPGTGRRWSVASSLTLP